MCFPELYSISNHLYYAERRVPANALLMYAERRVPANALLIYAERRVPANVFIIIVLGIELVLC